MPIELWTARMERPLSELEREAILPLLPPDRRERLLRIKETEKQREPLCAYLILCLALRQKYGWKELPAIALGRLGKPHFPEYPEVHFNISHSSGAVLVGVSDQEIGVDIERIRPVGQRMMVRLAHVSTEEAFFQSWVRREARAKRSGNGVGTIMRSESPLQPGEYYYPLDTFPGYAAGMATRSRELPGKLHRYSLDDML
ncbi:MAG: 4'-phosphopantetheinyl transferase [Oscillibacter sp.]|nr:4'-phosphopantetheinyl transferase [Oscillibacter sp.]